MNGIKIIKSNQSVKETVRRMITTIEEEGWHLFAHIDHAAEAKKKGLTLRSTQVILFGNPEIGTLLMQSNQSLAIDLPMKAMVWENAEGNVNIGYNTLEWLIERHGLKVDETIKTIAAVVEKVCGQT